MNFVYVSFCFGLMSTFVCQHFGPPFAAIQNAECSNVPKTVKDRESDSAGSGANYHRAAERSFNITSAPSRIINATACAPAARSPATTLTSDDRLTSAVPTGTTTDRTSQQAGRVITWAPTVLNVLDILDRSITFILFVFNVVVTWRLYGTLV